MESKEKHQIGDVKIEMRMTYTPNQCSTMLLPHCSARSSATIIRWHLPEGLAQQSTYASDHTFSCKHKYWFYNLELHNSSRTLITKWIEQKRRLERKMYDTSIIILQSNVVQLEGFTVETSFLSSLMLSKPKRSTVPLLFPLELSKSRDADGLLNCGEILFCKFKGACWKHKLWNDPLIEHACVCN